MDTAAPASLTLEVRRLAAAVPGVLGLDKCHLRRSGLALLVEIHIEVDPLLTVKDGHDIAHAVQDALVGGGLAITHVAVHVEPSRIASQSLITITP
jgi:divalent metal cation (Fe/Co/Zn/Cd) transporter